MEAYNIPLNGTSETLPTDLWTGMIRIEKGKQYILLKNAGVALADGKICMRDATVHTDISVVVAGGAITNQVIGVNNTGASIPIDHYFWALQRGRGYTTGSTIAINLPVMPNTAGTVVAAAGATAVCLGVCVVANAEILWNCAGGFGA